MSRHFCTSYVSSTLSLKGVEDSITCQKQWKTKKMIHMIVFDENKISKYIINIQDILGHLKSKDTCTISMIRQSSTFK